MRIELDLSQAAEWAAALPTWAWVAAAVHVWYWLLGVLIARSVRKKTPNFWGKDEMDARINGFAVWLFHPILAALAVVFLVGNTVLWASSGGIVSPPWR